MPPKKQKKLIHSCRRRERLYPNLNKKLIEKALLYAFQTQSKFTNKPLRILVDLSLFTIDNVILKYQDYYYKQKQGLAPGDNHSVSLANSLNKTILLKRLINDIIFLAIGKQTTCEVKKCLEAQFKENQLELIFRETNTFELDGRVEFLDVDHVIDSTSPIGFITRDYVKPTAKFRRFLHGASHHPVSVFKSILIGESKRLRRLNEKYQDFVISLNRLKEKALQSEFPKTIVNTTIKNALTWTNQNLINKNQDSNLKPIQPIT